MSVCGKCNLGGLSVFNLVQCQHIVCHECMCTHLETFSTCKIKCPINGCVKFVPDDIVRECLTEVQLESYNKLCLPPTARFCLIDGCQGSIISKDPGCHFQCTVCQQPNCLKCKNLHQKNEKCGISANKTQYEAAGAAKLLEKRRLELLKLTKESNVLKNPEKSECGVCSKFLLPRHGIMIFPCDHNFCRNCLQDTLGDKKVLAGLTCLACDTPLEHNECKEIIGEMNLNNLCISAVKSKFFQCKTPDCKAFWEVGAFTGVVKCDICHVNNCIGCNAVHGKLTCQQYQETEEYKDIQAHKKKIDEQNKLVCFNCNNIFVKKGGCGAMQCRNCLKQICSFTGKELGPNGCKCTSMKRCNKDCLIGCIPEGKSQYEEGLKRYFYDN